MSQPFPSILVFIIHWPDQIVVDIKFVNEKCISNSMYYHAHLLIAMKYVLIIKLTLIKMYLNIVIN